MYQWYEFKSRRGKNKNLTAQKSNSNTVWFNFQTYIYIPKVILIIQNIMVRVISKDHVGGVKHQSINQTKIQW